jgi:predicted transcriptional regulator
MQKKTVSMTVRLEDEIAAEILKLSAQDDRSVSYVIRKLLLQALDKSFDCE